MFKSTSTDSRTGPEGPVLRGPSGPVFGTSLIALIVGFGIFFDHTAAITAPSPEAATARQADLARQSASANVREVAQWAIDSGDHAGLPFVVVDKERARLFAFDAAGRLQAGAPVLLGALRGDEPDVPATPAGRFVADTWRSARSDAIVWVNGEVELSLHALPSPASPGRGLQRLASDRLEDKRISDGSLHVASDFYRQFLAPIRTQGSVAYVLPEAQAIHGLFSPPVTRVARYPGHTATRRPS